MCMCMLVAIEWLRDWLAAGGASHRRKDRLPERVWLAGRVEKGSVRRACSVAAVVTWIWLFSPRNSYCYLVGSQERQKNVPVVCVCVWSERLSPMWPACPFTSSPTFLSALRAWTLVRGCTPNPVEPAVKECSIQTYKKLREALGTCELVCVCDPPHAGHQKEGVRQHCPTLGIRWRGLCNIAPNWASEGRGYAYYPTQGISRKGLRDNICIYVFSYFLYLY